MTPRHVFFDSLLAHGGLGLVLLAIGTTACIVANQIWYVVIGEVNRKLPDSERFGYLWAYPSKSKKIEDAYRRFYPNGRLLIAIRALFGAMVVCGIALAFATGIIPVPEFG